MFGARRQRRGAQGLEFALAIPVLLMVGSGVLDYGWYFSSQHDMVVATQEAVRAGVDAALDEDPAELARARAEDAMEEAGLDHLGAEITAEITGEIPDLMLEVSISADFDHLVGVVPVPTHVSNHLATRLTYQ